jgi:hypothetical protein
MPSPVYQYVINLVVGLPIRTGWVFNDVGLLGKSGKMATMRVYKDVRLLGEKWDMAIMKLGKDVRLLWKSVDMDK